MIRSFIRELYEGPLAIRLRRFLMVGVFAAGVQMVLLYLFVDIAHVNYLIAATIAIEVTIILSYVLNNYWTFQASKKTERLEYAIGLIKTNLVRGSAIPIQLAILYLLVDWQNFLYLAANAVAIFVSGLYRYVLDARWTWG